ncbi:MAG: hypothetical protein MK100_09535, partial [Phycisphaerales bacterium]|nr:hypothetical protein [Phycisphaerales bacterium]
MAVYWAVLTHPVLDDQAVWLRGERVLWAPGGSNVANMDSPPDPNRLLLVVARVDMPDHGTPMDRKIQSGVTLELERTNAGAPWNIGDNVVLSRAALEDWVQEAIPDASVSTTQTQCDLLDQVLATPWNGTVAMPQGFQMRGMSTKY